MPVRGRRHGAPAWTPRVSGLINPEGHFPQVSEHSREKHRRSPVVRRVHELLSRCSQLFKDLPVPLVENTKFGPCRVR